MRRAHFFADQALPATLSANTARRDRDRPPQGNTVQFLLVPFWVRLARTQAGFSWSRSWSDDFASHHCLQVFRCVSLCSSRLNLQTRHRCFPSLKGPMSRLRTPSLQMAIDVLVVCVCVCVCASGELKRWHRRSRRSRAYRHIFDDSAH